jgi:hypothetical protein
MMVVRDFQRKSDCVLSHDVHRPPLEHLAAFATIDRAIYVPTIFTEKGMQPLRAVRPPHNMYPTLPPSPQLLRAITQAGSVDRLQAEPPHDPGLRRELQKVAGPEQGFFTGWPDRYQSLLVLYDGCARNPLPSRLDPVGSGDFFSLYRVHSPTK